MESYQTEGLPSADDMRREYRALAAALAPHADVLLCETLATVAEGVAAGTAASETGRPWWVSWTLEDSARSVLRSGEALEVGAARGGAGGVPQAGWPCCTAGRRWPR